MDGIKNRIDITRISIKDTRTPFSPRFSDIYFSADDGIEESTYVYLEGSGFLAALQNHPLNTTTDLAPKNKLIVGEVGFGVGLNFILTLKAFAENAGPEQTLLYFSAEQFPVHPQDLIDLYAKYPELEPYVSLLLNQYPLLTPGFHSIRLLEGRVQLILMLGEASELFSQFEAQAQFWYWDGFTPSLNPDAFSEKLFQQVVRLSAPQAQGATFTAAGWVRRGLIAAGFNMRKRVGFGRKRECLVGNCQITEPAATLLPGWFSSKNLKPLLPHHRVAVIGAGLSGSAIARSIANRGISVQIFDEHGIAERTSGNSIGLYSEQLSKIPNPTSRLSQLGLAHLLRELDHYSAGENPILTQAGILKTGGPSELAEASAGLEGGNFPVDYSVEKENGILFPFCGILNPRKLCEKRLDHPLIHFTRASVISVKLTDSNSHSLTLSVQPTDSQKTESIEFDHVIYATGADHLNHGLRELPFTFRPVRGQLIEVKPTAHSASQEYTLMQQGYATPIAPKISGHSHHVIGATYLVKPASANQVEKDSEGLVLDAAQKWSEFSDLTSEDIVAARVGFRLSPPDKMPILGPAVDAKVFAHDYEKVAKGARIPQAPILQVIPGEWLFTGMGSRGIPYSSLGAEILASLMCGDPLPVELDLWEHLHSARFLMRDLKKARLN